MSTERFLLAIFCLSFTIWSASYAYTPASTYTVTSLADTADANPGDNICADANDNCTLRAAVIEANTHPGSDTIVLPADTFPLSIRGAIEDEAATGDLDILGNVTITGAGAEATFVDATALGDRVFHVHAEAQVAFSDLTIRNGSTIYGGGAIYNSGIITLTGIILASNSADLAGGGLINENTATLVNSVVYDNIAGYGGGGIYNEGTVTAVNSTIEDNRTTDSDPGGGIYNSGTFSLTGSLVLDNLATGGSGGGIYNTGNFTMINSTIYRNEVSDFYNGGGIHNGATLTMTNSTLYDNWATGMGGGLAIDSDSVTVLRNSTLHGNTTGFDGGGVSMSGATSSLTIINSTISNNTAGRFGGGIYISGGDLNIYNATIATNQANNEGVNDGGGIKRTSGSVNLHNTILAWNGGYANGFVIDDDCKGTLGQLIYNLILEDDGCTFTNDHTLVGQSPRLGLLADNGGPTWTRALNDDSPAIDAGEPTGCKDDTLAIITTDQRGFARPADGNGDGISTCDIGAFEVSFRIFLPFVQR